MNKIESSTYKNFVIDLLQQGFSTREISENLKEKGFDVSHSVVNEFRKANQIEKIDSEIEQFEFDNEPEVIENADNLSNKEILNKIYTNQLLIVYHKQNTFISGKSKRFPESEFRALKVIDDLMSINKQDKLNSELDNEN
jgi:hypothetical protein